MTNGDIRLEDGIVTYANISVYIRLYHGMTRTKKINTHLLNLRINTIDCAQPRPREGCCVWQIEWGRQAIIFIFINWTYCYSKSRIKLN